MRDCNCTKYKGCDPCVHDARRYAYALFKILDIAEFGLYQEITPGSEIVSTDTPKLHVSDTVINADLCKCSHVGYVHSRIDPRACAVSSLKTGDCLCAGFELTEDVTITMSRDDVNALIGFLSEDEGTIEDGTLDRLVKKLKEFENGK